MPLDHKNKNGEYFSNFEFFWNKYKKEWVIIFDTDSYYLNLWVGPVDASYTELDRAGMVTTEPSVEILFKQKGLEETVSFLDGVVCRKMTDADPKDIFSHPRLTGPLAEFTSASKKIREITKEIGYPFNWAMDGDLKFYQHGGEEAADKLKEHLLIIDKNKDKKKAYWVYLKLAEEAENEIKKIFAELTQ
jgi:hypothetical protein